MQMPLPVFVAGVRGRLYVARPSYYSCRHKSCSNRSGRIPQMNIQKLPSDIIGLSKVMPPLSRRGFMSSSAAAAAGYTLAAGPVRADAIQTDTNGLKAGMADVAAPGANSPVFSAPPANGATPPVILVCMEVFGLHEWVKDITRRIGHLGAL